ncbi:MAG: SPOR domain-containing protein [Alloprevotella sp.]|nr:SPOR domain-containing protein [Alloprevotella sp.]
MQSFEKTAYLCNVNHLSRHIYRLLTQHNCVIVPDLGGFVAQHQSAHYDDNEGIFLPPCRIVCFNAQLTLNDGLLVQSYMQDEGLSFADASQRVSDDVAYLQQQLESEGAVELVNIGRLTLAADQRILFESEQASLTTPRLYGLENFSLDRIEKETSEPAAVAVAAVDKSDEPATTNHDDRNYTIRINREFANYVAAAMVALVCYFAWMIPSTERSDVHTAQIVSDIFFSPVTLSAPSPDAVASEASTMPQAETAVAAETPQGNAAQADAPVARKVYTIVLASQVSQHNAKTFVEKLAGNGFNDARIVEKKFRRVVYGSYVSENDAYNALRALRQQSKDFSEAWIMPLSQ